MPIKKPIAKKKEKKTTSDVTDFSVRTINPEIKYFEGKDSTYLVFRFISTNKKSTHPYTYTVYKAVTANHAAYDIDENLIKVSKDTRVLWDNLWFRTDVNYQVKKFVSNKKEIKKKLQKKSKSTSKKVATKKVGR
jgi:hypothetical protein